MSQPYLTNCAECERLISSSASRCPHCQTTSPFGITCHICKNKLRKSRAIQVLDSQYFAHEDCLDWVKEVVLENQKIVDKCPVCKTNITISNSPLHSNCPKCGHYLMTNYYAGRCKICGNTVLKGFEVKYDYEIYHKLCADKAYPNWEIKENQRQQKRQEEEQNKRQLEAAKAEEARKIRQRQELADGAYNLSIALVFGLPLLLIISGISGLVVASLFNFSSLGKIIGLTVGILIFISYLLPKK